MGNHRRVQIDPSPKFSKDTSIQSAIATVVKDSSGAWVVTNPQPAHSGR